MTGYGVVADKIDTHARGVAATADTLTGVADALPDRVGAETFGLFAQFLATGLTAAMTRTTTLLADAATATETLSTALRHGADTYRRAEDAQATAFEGTNPE